MNETQILKALEESAAERHNNEVLRRALGKKMRDLVRDAQTAGIGPTQIAQAADLSRQAVYEILRGDRPPS